MAAPIEQLLKSAKTLNAERLILEAGKSAFVWTNTGMKEITKTQLTPYDIFKLISPIMPEEKKVALVGQPSTEFQYSLEGIGEFKVTVIKESNGIKVIFKQSGVSSEALPSLVTTQPFVGKQVPPPTQPFPQKSSEVKPVSGTSSAGSSAARPAVPAAKALDLSVKEKSLTPIVQEKSIVPVDLPSSRSTLPPTGTLAPTVGLPAEEMNATAPLNEQQRAALRSGRPSDARPSSTPKVSSPLTQGRQVQVPQLPSTSLPPPPASASSTTMSRTHSGMAQTTERERIKNQIDKLLERTVKMNGSDLHLASGAPPIVRRFGSLIRLEGEPLDPGKTRLLLREMLTDDQFTRFEKNNDLDFSYEIVGLGRFRSNILRQYRGIDLTFHVVPAEIRLPEELGLPSLMREVIRTHQGLILITGTAGQGKSTTISSLIDVINTERPVHIITVEDPIEFVHPNNKRAIVNQREVGRHTHSFANALRAALREDPDVIVVGEMRDLETISLAITAAETGHLVMGTLMTSSAHQTIDRVLESFPTNQQNQIRMMLSESLRAVISQRLLPLADESGMVLAAEILLGTQAVSNLIRDKKTFQIPSVIQTSRHLGMKRMDDALLELVSDGKITPQKGLEFAVDKKAFEAAVSRR
jgi:twitching motility protein PilT